MRTCPAESGGAKRSHLPPPLLRLLPSPLLLLLISMLKGKKKLPNLQTHASCVQWYRPQWKARSAPGPTSSLRTNTSRAWASYMAAERREADVGVPTTAAHWRPSSPRKKRGKKRDKVETEAPGQRKWMGGTEEDSDVFEWAGLRGAELMSGLGLQLLPQVYGLLYARPSSTICVSWATEDCLQAPPAHTQHHTHTHTHTPVSAAGAELMLCINVQPNY